MAPRKVRTRRTKRRNVRRCYTKRRVGGKPRLGKSRTSPPLEEILVIPTEPMPTEPMPTDAMPTRGRQSRSPSPTNEFTNQIIGEYLKKGDEVTSLTQDNEELQEQVASLTQDNEELQEQVISCKKIIQTKDKTLQKFKETLDKLRKQNAILNNKLQKKMNHGALKRSNTR